jgi:tRNA (cmo5U34)-methyltransferase
MRFGVIALGLTGQINRRRLSIADIRGVPRLDVLAVMGSAKRPQANLSRSAPDHFRIRNQRSMCLAVDLLGLQRLTGAADRTRFCKSHTSASEGVMSQETVKDQVYREARGAVSDFRFDSSIATVFDDMVERSVPFYCEMQRMLIELAQDFAVPDSNIFDLGCSTGTTFTNLHPHLHPSVRFVGIDNSEEMLARCRTKLLHDGCDRSVDLRCVDLNDGAPIEDASVVMLTLTLQFIRPLHRDRLIADIFRGLRPQGCLLLVEKVLGEESHFNRLFIKYYYDMKRRNGYTETEIARKREALENVLIPYRLLENRELLLRTGFRAVDVFFKWYNFCGIVALK